MTKKFIPLAKKVIDLEIKALQQLKKTINSSFNKAVIEIAKCQSKVILCGVGKSGLIAAKISSTLSSVGTPSFNLSASDSSHGDLGSISKKDILILISYSGKTSELKNIIQYANRNKVLLIGIMSKKDSILYNGVKSQVLANQNINKANVYGFSVGVDAEVIKNLIIRSTLTYTKGYFITDNTKNSSIYEKQTNGSFSLVSKKVGRKPLDHIPPTLGKTSITYQYKKINADSLNVIEQLRSNHDQILMIERLKHDNELNKKEEVVKQIASVEANVRDKTEQIQSLVPQINELRSTAAIEANDIKKNS